MAIWLPIVLAHLAGWLLSIRPALRRVMLKDVCAQCGQARGGHNAYHPPQYVPLGATRDRNGGDVAEAIWKAFWWPFRLIVLAVRFVGTAIGGGIMSAVLRITPLTGPELERRLREQQEVIDRLSKELDDKPHAKPELAWRLPPAGSNAPPTLVELTVPAEPFEAPAASGPRVVPTDPPSMAVVADGVVLDLRPAHPFDARIDRICRRDDGVVVLTGGPAGSWIQPPRPRPLPLPTGCEHLALIMVLPAKTAIVHRDISTALEWPTPDVTVPR